MEKSIRITEAANFLGVSVKTMQRWDADGRLPACRTPGNHRAYNPSDLERFKNRKDFAQNYGSDLFNVLYEGDSGNFPNDVAYVEAVKSARKMGIDLLLEVHTNPVGGKNDLT